MNSITSFKQTYKNNREDKAKTYDTKANRLKLSQIIFKIKVNVYN